MINGRGTYALKSNAISAISGILANLLVIAVFINGFIMTHWYWPLVAFLIGIMSGLLINVRVAAVLLPFQVILSAIIIILSTIFFWQAFS